MSSIDPDSPQAAMGQRIATLRAREGIELSQTGLAVAAGITQPSLSSIENGMTREISARTLIALCRVLRTTVEYVWHGGDADEDAAMEEAELVAIFRQLLPEGRLALLQSARSLLIAQQAKEQATLGEAFNLKEAKALLHSHKPKPKSKPGMRPKRKSA